MYVKCVTFDNRHNGIFNVSKLTTIVQMKEMVAAKFCAPIDRLSLYFQGKHLEDDCTLHDYSINLNHVIQVRIKPVELEKISIKSESEDKENIDDNARVADEKIEIKEEVKIKEEEEIETTSDHYQAGDAIDCTDTIVGAWYEAVILKIVKKGDRTVFKVRWDLPESKNDDAFDVEETSIRPRAWKTLDFNDLEIGQRVMVNYNLESPKEIGHWYDLTISKIRNVRTVKELKGTIHIGDTERTIDDCEINIKQGVYQIEEPVLISERDETFNSRVPTTRRIIPAECKHCNDNPKKNCRECSCTVCGKKTDPHHQILCDECDTVYHISCLNPPLAEIPQGDWYCPDCKVNADEIVKVGEKVKTKKKQSKVVGTKRDWGKGMACVARTQQCTIVAKDHKGPIPNVKVGQTWLYRLQVSEAGVHRPHIAGISGNSNVCAYSIVFSGGYEGDEDNGDTFLYTGSGGRDLSGNKRTAKQSRDQVLTLMNKALALNCNAKLDAKNGAVATNWKKGIPIRVVRSWKAKHSKYAPELGYRYDGIYKVVKYWPEKGKSGFIVWRYYLKRDDESPAPWTKAGKAEIEKNGLKMVYPANFEAAQKEKNKGENEKENDNEKKKGKKNEKENEKRGLKRKTKNDADINEVSSTKKPKADFQLDKKICDLIEEDQSNKKIWDRCMELITEGSQAFNDKVMLEFACPVCQELVYKPVTLSCTHNICISCLKRSFKVGSYNCPMCRDPLDKDYKMTENKELSSALLTLFPGYENSR
ncbi:hypothetical protein TKK_0008288 [Trichogramma kaykai]|uniref:RING-type E3 ubiquitin transferase n=1 Tax=Trichogramma kaykai TaxID=54128 RepID=A0ABD2X4M9_9HYME